MQITKEFLLEEIKQMEQQRAHAHDVAVASQAAIDTMKAMLARLELPDPVESQNGYAV
jgi:predicted Rossmann fold nucleotide-binding protein DprA/Smf involved in DNA uptake